MELERNKLCYVDSNIQVILNDNWVQLPKETAAQFYIASWGWWWHLCRAQQSGDYEKDTIFRIPSAWEIAWSQLETILGRQQNNKHLKSASSPLGMQSHWPNLSAITSFGTRECFDGLKPLEDIWTANWLIPNHFELLAQYQLLIAYCQLQGRQLCTCSWSGYTWLERANVHAKRTLSSIDRRFVLWSQMTI